MIIREAKLSDAVAIAKVNVDTWRTAYKGIVDDDYLNELSYDKKEKVWISRLSLELDEMKYIFVSEDEEKGIIGFTTCGLEREGDQLFAGELYAIYVNEEYQNIGAGKMLFNRVVKQLNELKLNSMLIWALEANSKACRFYEKMGGKKVKEKELTIGNVVHKEIAYGWTNIALINSK